MKRFIGLASGFLFLLTSLSFSRHAVEFKNGEVVEGDLVKQDEVQVTIKLPSGNPITYYNILIDKVEPSADYHTRLGDDLLKKEKLSDAVKEYDKVLEVDPKNEHAQQQIDSIDKTLKAQHADKQSKQNDLAVALLLSRGMSLYRSQNYELAAKRFQEVLTYDPNNSQAKQYLKLSNQKSEVVEAQQSKNEEETIQSEKDIKEFQLKTVKENQAKLNPPATVGSPAVSGSRTANAEGNEPLVALIAINGSADSTLAILSVTSGTVDRELRLPKGESERVGNYRIRVNNIDTKKNEVEVEIIPAGTSVGQRLTLTPTSNP